MLKKPLFIQSIAINQAYIIHSGEYKPTNFFSLSLCTYMQTLTHTVYISAAGSSGLCAITHLGSVTLRYSAQCLHLQTETCLFIHPTPPYTELSSFQLGKRSRMTHLNRHTTHKKSGRPRCQQWLYESLV